MTFLNGLLGLSDNIVVTLAAFLFVLTIVVFIHEMGHFLAARWCGVGVETFSIGFGRVITSFHDRHGTRWQIAWIPLGGYVQFIDDVNAASVPTREAIEAMTPEERERSFHAKPLWQRAFVVAAGPLANFILAIVIYAGLFASVGQRTSPAVVDSISPGSAAALAGIDIGDRILTIDGSRISNFKDVQRIVAVSADQPLRIVVERAGKQLELEATPKRTETKQRLLGIKREVGAVQRFFWVITKHFSEPVVDAVLPGSAAAEAGLRPGDRIMKINGKATPSLGEVDRLVADAADQPLAIEVDRGGQTVTLSASPKREGIVERGSQRALLGLGSRTSELVHHGLPSAVKEAVKESWSIGGTTLTYLGRMLRLKESPDQLSGSIAIANIAADMARMGWVPIISIIAFLSVSIGLLNLFPVPMLDGGHLLFYGFEALLGRPLSERTQEIGFRIGFAMVIMLMVFTTLNDIQIFRPKDYV